MKAAFVPKALTSGVMQITGVEGRGGDPNPFRTTLKESIPAFAQTRSAYGNPATMFTQSLGQNVNSSPYNRLKNELEYKKNREILSKQDRKKKELNFQMRQQPTLAKAKAFWKAHKKDMSPMAYTNEKMRRNHAEFYLKRGNMSSLIKGRRQEKKDEAKRILPVSYTHLTLPTKRIV